MAQLQEPYYSRVEDVIRVIETEKLGERTINFTMARWWDPEWDAQGQSCGTAACIGGCTEQMMKETGIENTGVDSQIMEWLTGDPIKAKGLGEDNLFYPCVIDTETGDIILDCEKATKDQAIKVLRHLQATGEVDWTVTLEEITESA